MTKETPDDDGTSIRRTKNCRFVNLFLVAKEGKRRHTEETL